MNKVLIIAMMLGVVAQSFALPERIPKRIGDWEDLRERGFGEWSVTRYSYGGGVADGGSKIFEFVTVTGDEFDILVANSVYWTDEELKNDTQVFFLLEGDVSKGKNFFGIQIRSKEEEDVIRLLSTALVDDKNKAGVDYQMLEKLISHLKSRKPFQE